MKGKSPARREEAVSGAGLVYNEQQVFGGCEAGREGMERTEADGESPQARRWLRCDWVGSAILFLATAGVVIWQNLRLGILWDLSYVLENSWRISLGDVPYRDFPFPYAPLTFLIQAGLIKLTGRAFLHHVAYCAVVGGLGTVATWRILVHLLRDTIRRPRLVAFLLATPLIVLGIYCVYPHPFYDSDCTFAILLCVLLLLGLERRGHAPVRAFLSGAALIVPLFIKQNTGLAFLASAGIAIAALAAWEAWQGRAVSRYVWLGAGAGAGFGAALVILHLTVGLRNYERWTMEFAAARRLPGLPDMLSAYQSPLLPWWFLAFGAGAMLLWFSRRGNRMTELASVALMSIPFAWTALYLLADSDADASDRAERLLALWPFVLIVALVFAIWNPARRGGMARILPFVLIGTVQGAFLSQQLWGSTYAIWPLLMILFAWVLDQLASARGERGSRAIVPLAGLAALSMLVSGTYYVVSHERLNYADLSGQVERESSLPALRGLSIHGPWIPEFEELVRYSDQEIPRDQGLLMIPGEDLFYYATGRHPRFPVLMFDHTVNPYSPEQILALSRSKNICWLVVKKKLQLGGEPVDDKEQLLKLLRGDFTEVRSLANYDIYRRTSPGGCAEAPHAPPGNR